MAVKNKQSRDIRYKKKKKKKKSKPKEIKRKTKQHRKQKKTFQRGNQGHVSQKVVNRTISDLPYDHLPTKFATVSQNLSECFYDFRFTTCG